MNDNYPAGVSDNHPYFNPDNIREKKADFIIEELRMKHGDNLVKACTDYTQIAFDDLRYPPKTWEDLYKIILDDQEYT